ncbi:hypothetical protein [Endozoicomonas sp.]|uniref:hypothetical protein n=1 Tax=Endozoicomonas sp. TaxID=1892382 RepID=UPI0028845059|nr:hypothetical protein [Endozoicomonas sp.]
MKQLIIITLLICSPLAQAELLTCDQKQTVCEARCKASSLISEQDSNTCKAQCLGERTACELEQGKESAGKLADQAKDASQSYMEKLKAFWKGLTDNL